MVDAHNSIKVLQEVHAKGPTGSRQVSIEGGVRFIHALLDGMPAGRTIAQYVEAATLTRQAVMIARDTLHRLEYVERVRPEEGSRNYGGGDLIIATPGLATVAQNYNELYAELITDHVPGLEVAEVRVTALGRIAARYAPDLEASDSRTLLVAAAAEANAHPVSLLYRGLASVAALEGVDAKVADDIKNFVKPHR